MSRIGKQPVILPEGVTAEIHGRTVTVTGPKGELKQTFLSQVNIVQEGSELIVTRKSDDDKAVHGLSRALLNNMVVGVSAGFIKELEMTGIGYRSVVEGDEIVLSVGFSHQVRIKAPEGISFSIQDGKIKVSGIDKYMVGQIAANIRKTRPPEPYKGKGIHYVGEHIRRKAGKTAKATGSK